MISTSQSPTAACHLHKNFMTFVHTPAPTVVSVTILIHLMLRFRENCFHVQLLEVERTISWSLRIYVETKANRICLALQVIKTLFFALFSAFRIVRKARQIVKARNDWVCNPILKALHSTNIITFIKVLIRGWMKSASTFYLCFWLGLDLLCTFGIGIFLAGKPSTLLELSTFSQVFFFIHWRLSQLMNGAFKLLNYF